MNRKIVSIAAALLIGTLSAATVLAQPGAKPASKANGADQPPKMPYVFAMYCLMCHKETVQIGPMGVFDMQAKTGNPLHEQLIRNNVRFGMKAMPAFRLSEVNPKELDSIVNYMKEVAAYRKSHRDYRPQPVREAKK